MAVQPGLYRTWSKTPKTGFLRTRLISDLLKECNELTGSPFVRFGQVDVLEIEDQPLTVLGSVHPTGVGVQDHTGLAQLLQYVGGVGLGTAVDHSHLGGAQLFKTVLHHHAVKDTV